MDDIKKKRIKDDIGRLIVDLGRVDDAVLTEEYARSQNAIAQYVQSLSEEGKERDDEAYHLLSMRSVVIAQGIAARQCHRNGYDYDSDTHMYYKKGDNNGRA